MYTFSFVARFDVRSYAAYKHNSCIVSNYPNYVAGSRCPPSLRVLPEVTVKCEWFNHILIDAVNSDKIIAIYVAE